MSYGRAARLAGAIFGGAILGYVFRDTFQKIASSGEPRPLPSNDRTFPQRDVRPLGQPVLAGQLFQESRDRLRELETLATQNPRKALAKLPFFRDSELLPMALTTLARGWAANDPQAAAEWAARLESPDDQVSAALGLVPPWATADPEACLSWTANLPIGNMREVSLAELADTWGAKVPETALARFLSMKSEAGTERGLHAIVTQWALDHPTEAIEHLAGLDAAQKRDELLEAALVSLTNQDPDMAWRQANRFEDASRSANVRSMALEAMSETRPRDALILAESAGNPPDLLRAVARGWSSLDAAAAESWIATLPDPQLAGLLREEIAH